MSKKKNSQSRISIKTQISHLKKNMKRTVKKHFPTFVHAWHMKVDLHLFRYIFIGLAVIGLFVGIAALFGALNLNKTTTSTQASYPSSGSLTTSCTLDAEGYANIDVNWGDTRPSDVRIHFLDEGPLESETWRADLCNGDPTNKYICVNGQVGGSYAIRSQYTWYSTWVDGIGTISNVYCGSDNDVLRTGDVVAPQATCVDTGTGTYDIQLDWPRETEGETYDLRIDFSPGGGPVWDGAGCPSNEANGHICRRVPESYFSIESPYPSFTWWYHQVPRGQYETGQQKHQSTVTCGSTPPVASPTSSPSGPTPTTPASGACTFDTRTVTSPWKVLDGATTKGGFVESITTDKGYHNFNYTKDTFTAPAPTPRVPANWPGNSTVKLSEVPRYSEGPCSGRGDSCRFDARTLFHIGGSQYYEVIAAYGKIWKYAIDLDQAYDASNPLAGGRYRVVPGYDGADLASIPYYSQPGGPCESGICSFDTMVVYKPNGINSTGSYVEEITVGTQLWSYVFTNPETMDVVVGENGTSISSIARFIQTGGPCEGNPDCVFDSRSVYYNTIDNDDPADDFREDIIIGENLWRFKGPSRILEGPISHTLVPWFTSSGGPCAP